MKKAKSQFHSSQSENKKATGMTSGFKKNISNIRMPFSPLPFALG